MTQFDAEDFWDDLLAFVEQRRVIPVLGSELLTIREENGRWVRLYKAVADRLMEQYDLPPLQGEDYGLHQAVCAIAASQRRPVKDLYRPVHGILQQLLADDSKITGVLRDLAAVRHFDLFVTTTPDDLMARALNVVRFENSRLTDEIEYAPKLPTLRRRDIPESPSSAYAAVFYLFGKADPSPLFAIHDEDALEFPYMLQMGSGPERMLSEMRSRHLLLIGCTFADWLNRFFLRLSNTDRLSSNQRAKKEYLVGQETARDHDFVVFLERFSQDSRCYPIDATTFVAELLRRWRARNPVPSETADANMRSVPLSGGTLFISYAKEDVGPARVLSEDLQRLSGDVAWFDKTTLTPGDKWEEHIHGAIERCGLFLPLISSHTERRTEGYFRREWDAAATRSTGVLGRKFILPIVIDADYNGDMSRYALVNERFKAVQYSHAPRGEMSEELRNAIQNELRHLRRGKPA